MEHTEIAHYVTRRAVFEEVVLVVYGNEERVQLHVRGNVVCRREEVAAVAEADIEELEEGDCEEDGV